MRGKGKKIIACLVSYQIGGMLWGDCPEEPDLPEGPEVPEVPEVLEVLGHPESLDPPGYPGYPGHLGLPALLFTESHRAP